MIIIQGVTKGSRGLMVLCRRCLMLADYIENKPTIKTERLTLRTMTEDDVPDLREWMPDKTMYKYWGKNPGKTDKNPELPFQKAEKPTKSFHLGIEHRDSGKVIGEIWVYLIESNRMAKMALRIAEGCKGKGYATEALSAMVDFCFKNTELQRLWSDADVRNLPSCRVMEKCGFTREGTVRQGKMVSSWCDYHIYGILREDWEADTGACEG